MSEVIRVNRDLLLSEGYNEYEIDSERDLDLTIRAKGDAQLFVRILHAKSVRIHGFIPADTAVTILYWNTSNDDFKSDESYEVCANASLHVAYGEVSLHPVEHRTYIGLQETGAYGKITSASFVNAHADYRFLVTNYAPHTYGDMNNYAIILKDGRLMIDAVGKIVKGAYRSESHQESRALSFEEGQKSEILPELLIDENDVQASHAMSMGRMDDEQLYYLMSRGLSEQQCISLLSSGYLMPITKVIDNEELEAKLKDELERKLNTIC